MLNKHDYYNDNFDSLIAQNSIESAINHDYSLPNEQNLTENPANRATQFSNAHILKLERKEISILTKIIVKFIKRYKLNYDNLRYIFRCAKKECNIQSGRKHKKLPQLPTDDEISRFLTSFKNQEHRLIFETLLNTGLRVSELCNIEIRNMDWNKNAIFIKNGKGGKDRIVIFGNNLKNQLQAYLYGKDNRFLFETKRNWKYSPRTIQEICSKHLKLAKIEKEITPHTFRHIWCTKLAENAVSIEERALLAGHSNLKTQDIYTHLGVDCLKDKILRVLDK